MSVGLGTLKSVDDDRTKRIEVEACNYDSAHIYLSAHLQLTGIDGDDQVELELDRRQMQELSIIIDRFLDK